MPLTRTLNAMLLAASWAALFVMCWAALAIQPAHGQTWINASIASHHFGDRVTDNGGTAEWQEFNPGIGIEHAATDRIGLLAGVYHNSINRTSIYAGASLRIADIGPVSLGVQAMAVSGYTQRDIGAVATVTYTHDRWRAQLLMAPPVSGTTAGFIGLQIGIRM